ncbi:MAG: M1 family metallopeptidase [Myxococcaceae bacterium]|nr:M1 family metallopeptidase [Myxococcaceae bacterium]
MARPDPHSYADDSQPRTRSFDWKASVDFDAKTLACEVTLHFTTPSGAGPLDLDTRGLSIDAVTTGDGSPLRFVLHPADAILGSRLEVTLPTGVEAVRVRYRTSPTASALQWLAPEMTAGGAQPYLFSQCQAIHARSVLPCQDTPSFRQTYTASLDVPASLRAVMAAASSGREVQGARAVERFAMPQPIPPYLFAFAVGDLASRDLSARSRVWAEPSQLDAAAWEFADVERHLHAAEALFGPYDWERFDLLVMPPSFPYGGMENPRLTFLTPTLLAGDRSLVNVVAHELAHSWTGNLVTNATAEHFWLNEGFTVFAERRILEALEGEAAAALHAAIGFEALKQAFAQHAKRPELTRLRTTLAGIDPDDAFSQVPYEKGFLFLKTLEAAAGREAFDRLLKGWLATHRFGAATTDDFLATVERDLPGLLAKVNASAWVDGPGLPHDHWRAESSRLSAVRRVGARVPSADEVKTWGPPEWQLYLDALPRPVTLEHCRALDSQFHLGASKNAEVLVSYLTVAAEAGDESALPKVEEVLGRVGRMKYLKPLYRALVKRPATKDLARSLFGRFKPRYHPIAQQVLAGIVNT